MEPRQRPVISRARRATRWLVAFAVIAVAQRAGAGNIDPVEKFAWGENVGWFNFAPSQGPGVTVTSTALSGFAWAENIGWINLNPTEGGVFNDGQGNLSGFAWGENVGWINFAPIGGGVRITQQGLFVGYAWGENIGWVTLSSSQPVPFGVRTSFRFLVAPALGGIALVAAVTLLGLTARRTLRRQRACAA